MIECIQQYNLCIYKALSLLLSLRKINKIPLNLELQVLFLREIRWNEHNAKD
jgi:hypothetical protein